MDRDVIGRMNVQLGACGDGCVLFPLIPPMSEETTLGHDVFSEAINIWVEACDNETVHITSRVIKRSAPGKYFVAFPVSLTSDQKATEKCRKSQT